MLDSSWDLLLVSLELLKSQSYVVRYQADQLNS